jgi:UDP-GlcNAc:undecaprenyl-phosphate GlcNAc-1-phosphate transferase
MLYGFATVAGALSLLVSRLALTQSLALVAFFTAMLVIVGVYLSQVKVYEPGEAKRSNAVFTFLVDVSYKRRIFEVFLDALLITLSYYASYTLLFGPIEGTSDWNLFITTVPLLVVMKLGSFLFVGVYRGLWRYTSVDDLIVHKGRRVGVAHERSCNPFAFSISELFPKSLCARCDNSIFSVGRQPNGISADPSGTSNPRL